MPENITEIDRLKLFGQLGPCTDLYVMGHVGNTHNEFRESDRKFYGVDARVTNTSIDGLSLTAYGKTFTQNNSADTVSLNTRLSGAVVVLARTETRQPQTPFPPSRLTPITPQQIYAMFLRSQRAAGDNWASALDREWLTFGVKGRWRPFHDACDMRRGMSVTGGYEWSEIRRTNVTY